MNQHQAFLDTVALAERYGVPELPGSPLGLEHLRAMSATVRLGELGESKLGRWLGWAQCAVVAADVGVTLDDFKRLNLIHADAPTGFLVSGEHADEKIAALLNDAAAVWDGYHDTHHEFCYRVHAGCLAHRIRKLMTEADEWEYATEADEAVRATLTPRGPRLLFDDQPHTPEQIAAFPAGRRVRRRKAGPWEPVP